MATYIDPNSGAASQPGGVAMPVVEIPVSGLPVEQATAPDVMDVGVLVEPKPKKPRAKKVISDTSDVAEVAEDPIPDVVISDTSEAEEGAPAGDTEHESADA